MKNDYRDIVSRIAEAPTWFDSNGVPRFGAFVPRSCPNIYANQVALLEIECQNCAAHFNVEVHYDPYRDRGVGDLKGRIEGKTLHYGDPPIHGCTGDTMNSVPLRVLEFWGRGAGCEYRRSAALEVEVRPAWADDPL